MTPLYSPGEVGEEERTAGFQWNKPSVFPAGLLTPRLSHLMCGSHDHGMGGGVQLTLMN